VLAAMGAVSSKRDAARRVTTAVAAAAFAAALAAAALATRNGRKLSSRNCQHKSWPL